MFITKIYNLYFSKDKKYFQAFYNTLGFVPNKLTLYKLAFRHRSAAIVLKDGFKNSNERLEFLGDAVLGAVIAEFLFKKYPYKGEGFLTEMRSKIVNRMHLNFLSQKMGVAEFLEYDAKAVGFQSKQSSSIMGDALEALIGAIYIDKGYNFTKDFILNRIIKTWVDIKALEIKETNFKSRLIEWAQRMDKTIVFEVVPSEEGSRSKLFNIKVLVDDVECGTGADFTKKNAEKIAAEHACEYLNIS